MTAAVGVFPGHCGAPMSPMAANFKVAAAVLLDWPDQNADIRVQWPTAAMRRVVQVARLNAPMVR